MKKITLFFIIAFIFNACGVPIHEKIPTVPVDITISLGDANYYKLNQYGGHLYLTGGVSGIIVYRLNDYTFKAYDRACPYDWENPDSWLWVEDDGLMIYDSCCGSRFNILDGTVVNGPANLPLKYYRATFDGMLLRIYN